jgi:NDP-sugar pyrophosphorylase family protein/SAM-dependent methyltransferase
LDKHKKGELAGKLSDAFVERMSAGLQSWVDQAANKNLAWGYMVFKKPLGHKLGSHIVIPKSPSYRTLSVGKPAVTDALVVAASRLSDLDSLSGPKCLIRLGNLPIICHVLSQLCAAGVERAVVLCGYKGERIKEAIERDLDQEIQDALQIEYLMVGEDWRQGSAYSVLRAQNSFTSTDKFLVCMADHLFDPSVIASMCAVPFTRSEQAFCLLETDTQGMVGMSASSVKVKLIEGTKKVESLGRNMEMEDASGVDAGLFTTDFSLFQKLQTLSSQHAYFTLADAFGMYANNGDLLAVKTDGKMWFAVETKEALGFAVADGLKQIGMIDEDENWLSDGAFDQDGNRIPILLSGHGKEIRVGGSKWSEFTVERWRSAVYINLSFFGDLYTDTQNFITEIAKHIKLRGERTSLIEVGCGTGEFIRPIADNFRLSIGMDFNKNFIDFCNENIPKGKEEKMAYYEGDACELMDLMRNKAPKHIWDDTRIVACVGNTIGIIPENLKERVYRQMAELAGPGGVVVIVYWNARCFGDACQNFYHANPQLCGPFAGDSIDFNTTTLQTPAPWNYRSHWTGVDEARGVLRKLGLEEIMVEEKGKGVLVAARVNTKD